MAFSCFFTDSRMKMKVRWWNDKQTGALYVTQQSCNQIPPVKRSEGGDKKLREEMKILHGNTPSHYLRVLFLSSISLPFFLGCGTDRVDIEFQSSRGIYIDDSKTDPDKLNRELEYDLKEAERQRLQKQRAAEAEAKAKAEAKRKAEAQQENLKSEAEKETDETTAAESYPSQP